MKKSHIVPQGPIHKGEIPNPELLFSFKYFDASDSEICPSSFSGGYTQTLMDRLKALSAWTMLEFTGSRSQTIRSHPHNWELTSRPEGFQHLPKHLRSLTGWQFQLSSNEHGRVHGFLIRQTFYVVWLDRDHKLYP